MAIATPAAESKPFVVSEAHEIVRDLMEPKAWIYWTDFLLSWGVGTVCFWSIQNMTLSWPVIAVLFLVNCLTYYRAVTFIHEMVHLRRGSYQAFRVVWNLLIGIPFLMPSFTYLTHVHHHQKNSYGTDYDGEYLPLAKRPVGLIFFYLSQSFVLPLLAITRFLILTPLTWISPKVRQFAYEHCSSMIINPKYVRPLPSAAQMRSWRLQELACFLFLLFMTVQLFRTMYNPNLIIKVNAWFLLHAYCLAVTVLTINAVRTLGAHRYRHDEGELTFEQQLADSYNYPNNPILSGLWAPIGMRFHALHHLFPAMPYHNLAEAHARLMRELPEDSVYRQTECPGLWWALKDLWREASRAQRQAAA